MENISTSNHDRNIKIFWFILNTLPFIPIFLFIYFPLVFILQSVGIVFLIANIPFSVFIYTFFRCIYEKPGTIVLTVILQLITIATLFSVLNLFLNLSLDSFILSCYLILDFYLSYEFIKINKIRRKNILHSSESYKKAASIFQSAKNLEDLSEIHLAIRNDATFEYDDHMTQLKVYEPIYEAFMEKRQTLKKPHFLQKFFFKQI